MLPASAGMILISTALWDLTDSAPRIRGDDPGESTNGKSVYKCSPHPRG